MECSAATYVGGGRVMFRDLHALTGRKSPKNFSECSYFGRIFFDVLIFGASDGNTINDMLSLH